MLTMPNAFFVGFTRDRCRIIISSVPRVNMGDDFLKCKKCMVGACVYWRLVDGSILYILLNPKKCREMVVNFMGNPNTIVRPLHRGNQI